MGRIKKDNVKFLISVVLLIMCLNAFSQKKKCKDLGNGTYLYIDPAYANWVVYRKDSLQIEIDTRTGVELHMDIKWISNCDYTLTYTKALNHKESLFIGKTMNVEIVSINKNIINYRSSLDGIIQESGMVKVSDKIHRIHSRGIRKQKKTRS